MLVLIPFLISLLVVHPSAGKYVKVPLDLGPRIPLVKGDPGSEDKVNLVKREMTGEFVPMESNLKGYPGQGYSFSIGIGTPQQKLNVLIDTGSSNFAVAGGPVTGLTRYFNAANSTTFRSLGRRVYVPYTLGSWSGILGRDKVSLDFMPAGKQQFWTDVTPIVKSSQFFIAGATWEGIVGLAYQSLARPTGNPAVPFFDSLVRQTGTPDIFSTQLCGSAAAILKRKQTAMTGGLSEALSRADEALRVKSHGSFIIGGIDSNLYKGPLLYAPNRKKWFYEVVLTGITINGQQVQKDCKEYNFDKTIVDTGTTDLRIPKRVFNSITTLMESAIRDKPISNFIDEGFFLGTRMICVQVGSTSLFDSFPMIVFDVRLDDHNVIRMPLSPQQYLRYVGYNSGMGRDCFKYGIQRTKIGTVLGSVFLEGFYVVYDRARDRIGFAQSTCNYYGAKVANSSVSGPIKYQGSGTTNDCAFNQAPSRNMSLIEAVSIALGILCLLIFVPIIILLARMNRSQPGAASPGRTPSSTDGQPPSGRSDRSHLLKR